MEFSSIPQNPKAVSGQLLRKFKSAMDISHDKRKEMQKSTHEAIELVEKRVEKDLHAEKTRLSTLLNAFYCKLDYYPNDDVQRKTNQLASLLSKIDCSSCSETKIKNGVSVYRNHYNNLNSSVVAMEKSCTSFQSLLEDVDKMEKDLERFSKEYRLSSDGMKSEMRSLQGIKKRHTKMSKSLSQQNKSLTKSIASTGRVIDHRVLVAWSKEIKELKERRAHLSERVDQYMGISVVNTFLFLLFFVFFCFAHFHHFTLNL
uniref:Uncharacterized protein n=1 Tax=Trichobilharzia regenti TaxID=157069 RepID=A0AA85J2X8_TRIRE|nr:unnamed protein product [Trichobilharzia regenti]